MDSFFGGRLNGLDLFSGIGGLALALKEYVRPVAYCEIDKYAQGILLSRMESEELPVAPIFNDIKNFSGQLFTGEIDIIYGGFPCQNISVAGRGEGLDGKQSGLFFEILRLAKEIKPPFLFLENVPAIRTRGLDRVGQELANHGYDCRWGSLSAFDVGAPHKRERWFLLAYSESFRLEGLRALREQISNLPEKEILSGCRSEKPNHGWEIEPPVGRLANGIPNRVDRIKCLGNAVVPNQAKEAFEKLIGIKS